MALTIKLWNDGNMPLNDYQKNILFDAINKMGVEYEEVQD